MAIVKDSQKIKVRMFMEVMGWPKEKLREHLEQVIKILKEKTKWKITNEKYAEPEKVGDKMFTNHVEFEGEASSLHDLFLFSMTYGPSVVEIIDPPEFYMTAGELQDILADLVSKVQSMDKEIKVIAAQNRQMSSLLNALEKKGIVKKKPLIEKKSKE